MKDEQDPADRHGWLSDGHEASMALPTFLLGKDVEECQEDDTVRLCLVQFSLKPGDRKKAFQLGSELFFRINASCGGKAASKIT